MTVTTISDSVHIPLTLTFDDTELLFAGIDSDLTKMDYGLDERFELSTKLEPYRTEVEGIDCGLTHGFNYFVTHELPSDEFELILTSLKPL